MPLKDAPTPSVAQLAEMAQPSADDIDRAARGWRRNVSAVRASLRQVLDADTEGTVGRATGPIPDEA